MRHQTARFIGGISVSGVKTSTMISFSFPFVLSFKSRQESAMICRLCL